MSIERVNIQTPNFSLRASHIRGGQLQNILNAIRRTGAAATNDSSAARLGSSGAGPGAIQSPAERFPQLAGPSSTSGPGGASSPDGSGASSSPSDPSSGFASGGADSMRSLDSNQMMRTIMQLLERLLQAIFQMLGQQQGGATGADSGDGSGQGGGCGGGAGGAGGAGGPATCGDGGMQAAPMSDPTMSDPTSCGGGSGDSAPTGTTATPPRNGNGHACSPGHSGRSRARPHHRPSSLRSLLRGLKKGAAAAAPLVPGGGAVRAGATVASHLLGGGGGDASTIDRSGRLPYSSGGAPTPTNSLATQSGAPSSFLSGGSFEDRLFEFLGSRVKQSEQDLDSAMQQGDSGGGGGQGDSRTLASQRVQQLVQKRSELVETLTNTLKTLHESTQAVTNNLK